MNACIHKYVSIIDVNVKLEQHSKFFKKYEKNFEKIFLVHLNQKNVLIK